MNRLLVLSIILVYGLEVNAQTGSIFWFAAPDVSAVHDNNSVPLYLHITAVNATQVTISRPADPTFTPLVYNLADQQTQTITLSSILAVQDIEVYSPPITDAGFLQNKGFQIQTVGGDITAYYELDGTNNREIFALKSANALGTDFWVSAQHEFPNASGPAQKVGGINVNDAFSGFVVVATMPNTIVTVFTNGNDLENYAITPATINIPTMGAGQAFAIRAKNTAALKHIMGIRVVSNNPIAIIYYDDSILKKNNGGGSLSWDIVGDQIVPTSLLGHDYIVMKGNIYQSTGGTGDGGERICITTTQPNTQIYIDGFLQATIPLAGSYWEWGDKAHLINNQATFVHCTQPVYLLHISGTANASPPGSVGGELGGPLLPTIDGCTGSHSVTIFRSALAATTDNFIINLMVRVDLSDPTASISNFVLTVTKPSGAITVFPPIPSSYFTYIMGGSYAILDRTNPAAATYFATNIKAGDVGRIDNNAARFHLGVMHGGTSNGCKYGYFSDYADNDAEAGIGGATQGNMGVYCSLDPVRLVASGGKKYAWYCYSNLALTHNISDTTKADPYFYPTATGYYQFKVIVTGECFIKDTLDLFLFVIDQPVADFDVSADEGCSPFAPVLTNKSITTPGGSEEWVFETTLGNYIIDQDTIPTTFPYLLPPNNTDTIQKQRIRLIVKGPSNTCATEKYKEIKVKPRISSDFTVNDSAGCQPLSVKFTNKATGNLDSASFFWDFGDYSQSFVSNPIHSYQNYGLKDTIFAVKLLTKSPFGCKDSAYKNIKVYPRIVAALALDKSLSCSPLKVNLDPMSSVGVDTFIWRFNYGIGVDSIFKTVSKSVRVLNYRDLTSSSPDTLSVILEGINIWGCKDIFPKKKIIVYPELRADFIVDTTKVCDSVPILFTNKSYGYHLFYNWDFGDGSIMQDTTKKSYSKFFFNRAGTGLDIKDTIRLKVTSDFFCEDMDDTIITVHPYVNANFGLGYLNSCAPIDATFTNLSKGVITYNWDFGDGNTSHTALPVFSHPFWTTDTINSKTYKISLVTLNNQGCSDTMNRNLLIYPQVVAKFTLTPSTNCSPKNELIVNGSKGGSLNYMWQFGDNQSGTDAGITFTHIYNNLGQNDTTYYIKLTASNAFGCDSTVRDSVKVFAYIDANFNLPKTDSCSPFKIKPINLSSVGSKLFDWNIGALPVQHTKIPVLAPFTNQTLVPDSFSVTLRAYGAMDAPHQNCADIMTKTVKIYPELKTSFTLDKIASCQPYISGFTNNTNIRPLTDFEWSLDGIYFSAKETPDSIKIPNLTSSDVPHSIELYGESQYGCQDDTAIPVTVYAYIDAKFTLGKPEICSRDSVQINSASSSGQISSYEWDFGDGTPLQYFSYSPFKYPYDIGVSSTSETKQISLTVYNAMNCPSIWVQNLKVNPASVAIFSCDTTSCYPNPIKFTNTSRNLDRSRWDFGDGSGSAIDDPLHFFQNFDQSLDSFYRVKLVARSLYNCLDSAFANITIYAKPNADFTMPKAVDCPPFTVRMTNLSKGNFLSYLWTFSGTSSSTETEPDHTFYNNGTTIDSNDIKLIVTSAPGCKDTVSKILNVFPNVRTDFTMSDSINCSPLAVKFTGNPENVDKLYWYVDGTAFSTLDTITYRFDNESDTTHTYYVKFDALSVYGCSATKTRKVVVYPTPTAEFIPVPVLTDYNTATDQTKVVFNNESRFQNAWKYLWDYGDGLSNDASVISNEHYYGAEVWGDIHNDNKISVKLIAWNNDHNQCRDTIIHDIIINPPLPLINLGNDTAGCPPFTIDFSAFTKYNYPDQFKWEFGENNATSTEKSPSYTYTSEGQYPVKLEVNGDGGTKWDYKIINVYRKPEVSFFFSDTIAYDSSQTKGYDNIKFYNKTLYGSEYSWYFDVNNFLQGGPSDSHESNPTWHYMDTGWYHIALVAMSVDGCYDTLINSKAIHVEGEAYLEFPTGFFLDASGPGSETVDNSNPLNPFLFYPVSEGVIDYKLEIYDRWGSLVFKTTDVDHGWNGYKNGQPCDQGVYVWRARGRFTNGQPYDKSGDVTLLLNKSNR